MEFDKDEEKIKALLRDYAEKPPEELMKNYVAEVRRKIGSAPGPSPIPGVSAMILLIALSLLGALVLLKPAAPKPAMRPAETAVREVPGPAQPEARPQVTATGPEEFEKLLQQAEEQADFEELAESLMILELLGEDEGIADDYTAVEADMEFFAAR